MVGTVWGPVLRTGRPLVAVPVVDQWFSPRPLRDRTPSRLVVAVLEVQASQAHGAATACSVALLLHEGSSGEDLPTAVSPETTLVPLGKGHRVLVALPHLLNTRSLTTLVVAVLEAPTVTPGATVASTTLPTSRGLLALVAAAGAAAQVGTALGVPQPQPVGLAGQERATSTAPGVPSITGQVVAVGLPALAMLAKLI